MSPLPRVAGSYGFKLVVNVTNISRDFNPPIHNTFIKGTAAGNGQEALTYTSDEPGAPIFYANGTIESVHNGQGSIQTDDGVTLKGLVFEPKGDSDTLSNVHLQKGPGEKGIALTYPPERDAFLVPKTFIACHENIADKDTVAMSHAKTTISDDGSVRYNVPDECIEVRLLPEARELPKPSPCSAISHKFAQSSRCYKDVSKINWP